MPFDGLLPERSDPYSLETLGRWAAAQPPEKTYSYIDVSGHCLLGQYARYINRQRPWWARLFCLGRVRWQTLNFKYPIGTFNRVAVGLPRTFAAASHRALTLSR